MKKLIAIALSAGALLSGCYIPEGADVSITLKNGSPPTIAVGINGVMADGFALGMSVTGEGKLKWSQDSERVAQRTTKDLSRKKGVKSAVYKGKGRVEVEYEQLYKLVQKSRGVSGTIALDLMVLSVGEDGIVTIRGKQKVSAREIADLDKIGVKPKGKLRIRLDDGAEVISENADSKPGLFSREYVWDATKIDRLPMISFRVKGF